ncbi:hypothetical protein [Levilactobacillus fujinensis]|uniref:Uncharacterized protein n=1 Tax=Levilactobacillus fujinensis TaxID=2486024 RepID=A0ABW1TI73_9LACO|nr:hypothetical protein [Levilactobacillus fujinensis]
MSFPDDIYEASAYEWLKQQDLTDKTPAEVSKALAEAIKQAKGISKSSESPWTK